MNMSIRFSQFSDGARAGARAAPGANVLLATPSPLRQPSSVKCSERSLCSFLWRVIFLRRTEFCAAVMTRSSAVGHQLYEPVILKRKHLYK